MNTYRFRLRFFSTRHLLLLLSALGLLLGILLSVSSSRLISEINVAAFCAIPTYFSLLIINVIPIVILACLLAFSLKAFCYPFILLYSVCRGFVGMFFCVAFGSGAWLARFLIWFSSYITAVLIWRLLLRNLNQTHSNLRKDTCVSLLIVCGVTVIDFVCIAPLISNVIS